MHELALTCNIVEIAAEAAAGRRVRRVTLEIGRLSGVMTEAVRFCFDEVARGTALDGAMLDILEPEGRARCNLCGAQFATQDWLIACDCGSVDCLRLGGEELAIKSIELEDTL
jgi:hydrogenase nickel incorporation protein HypA/HybF